MTVKTRTFVTIGTLAVVSLLVFVLAAPSLAAAPWWHLTSGSNPTYLQPEVDGQIVVTAANLGDGDVDGGQIPVRITDTLPPGLKAVSIVAQANVNAQSEGPVTCVLKTLVCTFAGVMPPYDQIEVRIGVEAKEEHAASGENNEVSVSGGEARSASIARPITISNLPIPFGLEDNELTPEAQDGTPDTQAGSHPFQITSTLVLNRRFEPVSGRGGFVPVPVALAKNISVKLPPGVVGDPSPVPRCTLTQFLTLVSSGVELKNACPPQTAVGVATVKIYEPATLASVAKFTVPLVNLEPSYGEPARFGFFVGEGDTPVFLDTSVRSGNGEDYGITVTSPNTTQTADFLSSEITFWGTPSDPRHDNARGWGCLEAARFGRSSCQPLEAQRSPAFLTLPTSCTGSPLASSTDLDSWAQPAEFAMAPVSQVMPTLDGCNQLPFSPKVAVEPTTSSATSPTGLEFNLNFNDEGLTEPSGLAQSQMKKAVVTLPEGMTANPSVAAGLSACSEAQYESETVNSEPGTGCPEDSKIGDVEVQTPLLEQALRGSLFIAKQNENPFRSLLALYVVIKNPETGILVRLAGKVEPNLSTGQLVSVFDDIPQFPISHFRLGFRQGQRSPLVSPPGCGVYTTQAELYPWSDPEVPVHDSSVFQIETGVDGGACPAGGVPSFSPDVVAGTLNNSAGSYSPFDIRITRNDDEQEITGFSSQLPLGLTANLSGVPFCSEADIALAKTKTGAQEETEPSCPAASQIGHTLVGVGVGSVLAYTPGRLYMAGPFERAPFSIVAITSAKVGPFDLGTVVVHLPLQIDPNTAAVSVAVGGSDQIPHILDGIVVHVRDVRVYVDRPNFTLNPTNCKALSFSATVIGSGANFANPADDVPVTASDPFEVANCANLAFKPAFRVSTAGKTSRASGASLTVKLSYPKASQGTQANIAKVKVDLPKRLPSRLTTLQKACPDKTFESNPAMCPAGSRVGMASAITPILPVPLTGPAYFVSHGGAKFPELIVVLQGYGVTIELHGETFISPAGITSSTFRTVPDQPVTSFSLTLPQGKKSALAANGNLCGVKLAMPTQFVAQNGATLSRSTPIAVTGCAKHKTKKKPGKAGKKRKRKK
jgi:hypothetical protein